MWIGYFINQCKRQIISSYVVFYESLYEASAADQSRYMVKAFA